MSNHVTNNIPPFGLGGFDLLPLCMTQPKLFGEKNINFCFDASYEALN